ncbi:MAG: radical SAM superfamily enzyme YgiQ (UPF0313 family) [Bacteriovoracaceae bacterium]|jgi:anaerobic magnesium-protoporphyrin IX monomethyl ester cyclase
MTNPRSTYILSDLIYLAHMPQWNISQPPMGISYIGSYLAHSGYNIMLSDFSIELYSQLSEDMKYIMDSGDYHMNWIAPNLFKNEVFPKIESFIEECFQKIKQSNPRIVGFSVLTTNYLPTIELAKKIKTFNPKIKIILGGPFVTRYEGAPDAVKLKCIDFVVPDEGEETCNELVGVLLKEEINDFKNIKGLMFMEGDKIIDTGTREMIADINSIPYPVYDLFPLDKYKSICIPILGSRGCIFKCSFCSETVLWKRFRYRTAENLIEEFKFHLKNFGTNSFYIVDSLINGNMKELVKFCKIVIKENLDISWGGKASIRTQMSKEILTLMAKAGCTNIQYGIESGSPQVIRDMRKGFTVDIAKRVLRDTYEAGIFTGTFFLVGFPTETEEHYQETKQFLKDIECYIDEVIPGFGMGIQPGSEVYNDQDKFGISWNEKGEWFTKHSTIEQRENRVSDFRKFCNRLNVTIGG